jgi:contractile injection system tube protein
MPDIKLLKAKLQTISWDKKGGAHEEGAPFEVQFNPQSLKVNYTNQKAGGDQPKGSAVQYVGKGTTKLTMELVFDITALETGSGDPPVRDVREYSNKVNTFMVPKKDPKAKGGSGGKKEELFVPPGVRFIWGDFSFDGVMDSVDETLDFWSEDGHPLRATLSISISKQEIQVSVSEASIVPFQMPAGANEFVTPPKGKGLPDVAGSNYRSIAAANGIENPRLPPTGALLDLSGSAGFSASARASLGLEGEFSAGATATGPAIGASVGFGAGAAGGATVNIGAGAGIGATASATASASVGASAGAGIGAGVSADAEASAGFR